MTDIVEIANRIASSGFLVKVNIFMWSGTLPPRPAWGNRFICTMTEDSQRSVSFIKKQIQEALICRSIQCGDERFLPKQMVPDWLKAHEEAKSKLASVVDILVNSFDILRDSARLAAASQAVKVWADKHPTEGKPPLSVSSHASNLVDSLMPSKDDIMTKFHVDRVLNTHSFLAMQKMNFLSDGEKRRTAWEVIDELVAGNVRKLIERLEYTSIKKDGSQKRLDRAIETVISFKNTDLMPELGLSACTDELYNMVNNKAASEVNTKELLLTIANLINKVKDFSTVSSIIKRLNS